MRFAGRVLAFSAAAAVAACGSGQSDLMPSGSVPPEPTVALSGPPTSRPTATALPSVAPPATAAPTAAGPVVLASTIYDYKVTVAEGPATLTPGLTAWDGVSRIVRDARWVDRARTPASGGVYIVMSPDAQVDVDAFAADLIAKYQSWNNCTQASSLREFTSVGRPGRSWIQTCGPGGDETFARAVIVDGGQGLLSFNEVPTDGSTAQDRLISFLENVELTGPARS